MWWFWWVAALLFLWSVVSAIFLRFPRLLHRPVAPLPFAKDRQYLHIAHRGGPGTDLPENTLASFRRGALHSDVLELDVRLTKDNVIVIAHDPDLHRLVGKSVLIHETNYDDLPPLNEAGERVCKLETLLDDELCKNHPICLDFKVEEKNMVERVYTMFEKRGRLSMLVWGSFSEKTRRKCQRLYPNVPTFCSLSQTAMMYLHFMLGSLPFVSIDSSLLATVLIREEWLTAFLQQKHKFPLSLFLRILGLFGSGLFMWLIEHPSFVAHLRGRGMHVVFWTANSEDDMVRIRRAGGSGHVSDFPHHYLHLKK